MSSSDLAISIRGLSKAYTIVHGAARRPTFRDTVMENLRHPFKRNHRETFWALKDVSFEVKRGEVVGIIGRNGAGKSTLLKILSRITEPTAGRVEVFGRVGSLLEVGTGFHPELTGRENIYLNGAILGMTRPEIRKQFDAIVDFAEVEKFLDTPVKRYSSGMYVRLAFAVAAHLEPELLVVDEVLAVGDAEFQKKCLGKMGEGARCGRTVLFVSHNMLAVQALCAQTILLSHGTVEMKGPTSSVVAHYMSAATAVHSERQWPAGQYPGDDNFQLVSLRALNPNGQSFPHYETKDGVVIEIVFTVTRVERALCVGFDIESDDGTIVLRSYHTDLPESRRPAIRSGINHLTCHIPGSLLNGGKYLISPRIGIDNVRWIVHLDGQISFELVLDHGLSPFWNSLGRRSRPGIIAPILDWTAAGGL